LFFKIDKEDYDILKTFLLFLNYMPRHINGISGNHYNSADIGVDVFVGSRLNKL
jgi:hypothetical protein